MPNGENDYDRLQSFSPGWREKDHSQGNRNNGGPDQTHHQNPHPAFADAAQMAQAAYATYVRFQQSRSPQAHAVQMNQHGQNPAPYSQGMDQTLFHSQLHRHPQYEQPQQHPQQPQAQQQHQQQIWEQDLHLPQPQPYKPAQAQLLAQQHATSRPSVGSFATSTSSKSPAVPTVSYAVPQPLRTHATPQMLQAYTATQSQKAPAAPQPSTQTVRSTSAPSVPSVTSKSTVPAAIPPMPKATVAPQTSAPAARSMPAASASPVNSTPAAPAVPQTHKATIRPQTTPPIAHDISAPSAPLDNFTPFRPASNPQATFGASVPGSSTPVAAPSTSTSGRNSPLSPQVRSVSGPQQKKGRPPIYPDVVGPASQSAGPGRAGDRWRVSLPTNPPPNGIPSQYQPVLSGLPVLRDPASASASASAWAPAPPPLWQSPPNHAYPESGPTPPLVNRFEPASNRSAGWAISRTLPPIRAYQPQPVRIYTSDSVQSRLPSTQPPAAKMRKLDDSSRQPVTPSSGTLNLDQYVRQSPSRRHIAYRPDIVERMNSSDVLVQSQYDPATIARDILIVADKHPTEKGLNHHLHSLRQNLQAVDYSSDLASFRWDIVDPWVNYTPSVEQAAYRAHQVPARSATRLETISRPPNLSGPASAEQSMPHVYARDDPTAPLARPAESRPAYNTNTGITTTTATTSTGSTNSSLIDSTLKKSGFSGSGTIRSGSFNSGKTGVDVTSNGVTKSNIGPDYPASSPALACTTTSTSTISSPPKSTPKPAPTPSPAVNLDAFGALPFKPPSYHFPLTYSLPSLPPPSAPPSVYPSVASSLTEPHTSVSAPISVTVAAPVPKPSPKKSVKSTPVRSSPSSSAASRPPPKAPQAPSKSPRAKAPRQSPLSRGLPEPQVVIPIPPQKMAPSKKKPGRPSQKDIQVEVAIDNRPATQYLVFKCKWTGCQAELHNMEAINSHILAVHIPHHIVCAWDDCTDKNPRAAADMWEHVREKHMIPLAWQLGDGPSASVTAADSYEQPELSGQGRQDMMTLPMDRDSVKIFSRIHDTQTSQQKAQLMEDGGRRWKEDAGPDMDTSDRPLSTPPRLMASSHTEAAYTLSEVSVVI